MAVTDHADTIRDGLDFYARFDHPGPRVVAGPPKGLRYDRACVALDALVAERQQARDERDALRIIVNADRNSLDMFASENKRLSDQLQQAIDALREIAAQSSLGLPRTIASEALANLGEPQ